MFSVHKHSFFFLLFSWSFYAACKALCREKQPIFSLSLCLVVFLCDLCSALEETQRAFYMTEKISVFINNAFSQLIWDILSVLFGVFDAKL